MIHNLEGELYDVEGETAAADDDEICEEESDSRSEEHTSELQSP